MNEEVAAARLEFPKLIFTGFNSMNKPMLCHPKKQVIYCVLISIFL